MRAAIEAVRCGVKVVVVSKGKIGASGATFHRASPLRGMQVSLTPEEVQGHIAETLAVAGGVADEGLVEILCGESAQRLRDLDAMGVRFLPDRRVGCFSRVPRAVMFEDLAQFAACMRRAIEGAVVIEHAQIVARVRGGAVGITRDRRVFGVAYRAVVLACGGGAGAYDRTLTSPEQVGSALSLTPAPAVNLPFVQIFLGTPDGEFFPLGRLRERPAIPGVERDDPAYEGRVTHFPYSWRGEDAVIDHAIARQTRTRPLEVAGVPVWHVAHAMNGGLRVDADGATSEPGVFACGEAAGGMHGMDRLGGNMILATQVFGARAGAAAARWREAVEPDFADAWPRPDPRGLGVGEVRQIRAAVGKFLSDHALVLRDAQRMRQAAGALKVYEEVLRDRGPRDVAALWPYFETLHALRFALRLCESCAGA